MLRSTITDWVPPHVALLCLALVSLAAPAQAQKTLPLNPGQAMDRNVRYTSPSGGHYLLFQDDGNLVVYTAAGGYVWGINETGAAFDRAARVVMQEDGNMGMYDADGQWLWSALSADPTYGSVAQISTRGALQVVAPGGSVRWASDGVLTPEPATSRPAPVRMPAPTSGDEDGGDDASAGGTCAGIPGWPKCVSVGSPDIRIYGTSTVSPSAMRVVARIYGDMTGRLRPQYPASRFNGYRVYLTNTETQQQLAALPEISEFAPDPSGPNSKIQLQGGTGGRHLWISEQMICKTGVASRGPSDTITRTFDQVVHEFSHAIDNAYGLRPRITGLYSPEEARAFPAAERFPWSVQHYFSTPAGAPSAGEQRLLNELFTGPTTYSCSDYRP